MPPKGQKRVSFASPPGEGSSPAPVSLSFSKSWREPCGPKKPKNSVKPSGRHPRKRDKVAAAMRLTRGGAAERNQREGEARRAADGDLLARAAELSSGSELSPEPEGLFTSSTTSTGTSEPAGEGASSQGGRPCIFPNAPSKGLNAQLLIDEAQTNEILRAFQYSHFNGPSGCDSPY
ncbi:hypothetical protein P170DRAFT_424780 [Aspergillus steynii IBT 23096]|uniref:Uncharacterized protein n=1 Tax=Aspergillus steynii IBT 23096 TaxID=1392250 RepID=A0A2I2GC03_9EURO|nr:uncharacterized protein P170DRAFT_424780 [Aspergillus steynii IBT 23096]PLB50399.1 hypothetical protein P170DRAFT_424780 [Aspergillus steynii IBT 23096]